MKTRTIRVGEMVIRLECGGGVFMPSKRSVLLAKVLSSLDLRGKRVIDVGCGTGFLSIVCALLGAREVLALDINPMAISATEKNWRLNQLKTRLVTKLSNVFEGIDDERWHEHFDLIISNPPGLPRLVLDGLERRKLTAWKWNEAGEDGRLVLNQIFKEGWRFLKPGGWLVLFHTSRLDFGKTQIILDKLGLKMEVLWETRFKLEPHLVNFIDFDFWRNKEGLVFKRGDNFFETVKVIQVKTVMKGGRIQTDGLK